MITGAGRTDAGVHAGQMYAHFETESPKMQPHLERKLNGLLPEDIVVKRIIEVENDSHARFSATSRTYQYKINQFKDPFLSDSSWFYPRELNVDKMNEAAKELFNHQDFSCFSKSKTDTKTNNCTITKAQWTQKGHILIFEISADRFLRNMVRAIVGTLIEVGLGKINTEDIKRIIESKNRSNAGSSVPAHGLFLTKIGYPKHILNE